ncbi:2-hydroxyacid dehydrogenase [Grosmannia clavigera kw1407]|uniref:2-hydroxyacid dehydrogenase n=1 Tax=Grosmannia clavigera (strain kw1407 / UAMH 11150) TaxID=655863 RepID=F0XNU2_GROCL|nr:2-hydroxyacid dehydrogenase [Grosmannia clavigera kw1407]EFX00041.1 2-hydroxyacid dehydrogenase [Grosmannia clavigera kw1407]
MPNLKRAAGDGPATPALKRRKGSIMSVASATTTHPLRQTSFPPEDNETLFTARSPSADIDNASFVSGSLSATAAPIKKRRGRKPKAEKLREQTPSLAGGRATTAVSSTGGAKGSSVVHGDAGVEEDDGDGDVPDSGAAAAKRTDEERKEEKRLRAALVACMDFDQYERISAWRAAKLPDAVIRRLVNATVSQSVPSSVVTAVRSVTKYFLTDLITNAQSIQSEWISADREAQADEEWPGMVLSRGEPGIRDIYDKQSRMAIPDPLSNFKVPSTRGDLGMAEPFNTPMPSTTPVPGATPRSTSPSLQPLAIGTLEAAIAAMKAGVPSPRPKPRVLHIGDPVCYNVDTYIAFSEQFDVIRPSAQERERPEFMRALRSGRWGDFCAIFRPFWGSGGEMGCWDAELIALLPNSCRIFASAGAGFDWADTKALGQRGIIYCNSGLAAAEAVADFAVAMVISTFRHLSWCMNAATSPALSPEEAKQGFQHCHTFATGVSHNLRNHVLGLVGLGNIGQNIAAKLGCSAFGMKIHYFDTTRKQADIEKELGATFHDTLEGLLAASDCVVICTPASPDGKPLMTKERFSLMKPHSRFVNVARGSLVDEEALADAIESGGLHSAAIDVHSAEPCIHPRLLQLARLTTSGSMAPPSIMLTCHNAGGTVETHIGFEELSMRNIMAVIKGDGPVTPVNMHHISSIL